MGTATVRLYTFVVLCICKSERSLLDDLEEWCRRCWCRRYWC